MDTITISQYITNGLSNNFIVGAIFFLLLAFVTAKFVQFAFRNPKSKRTPEKDSLKFWWKDNYASVVTFVLMTFPLVVFTEDYVHTIGLQVFKSKNPMWIYYFIGLLFGSATEYILKKLKLIRNEQSDSTTIQGTDEQPN